MKRLLLVAAAAVGLGACSDMFSPPPLPDLAKEPYDFAVVVPPFRGDMGAGEGADLRGEPADLATTD